MLFAAARDGEVYFSRFLEVSRLTNPFPSVAYTGTAVISGVIGEADDFVCIAAFGLVATLASGIGSTAFASLSSIINGVTMTFGVGVVAVELVLLLLRRRDLDLPLAGSGGLGLSLAGSRG